MTTDFADEMPGTVTEHAEMNVSGPDDRPATARQLLDGELVRSIEILANTSIQQGAHLLVMRQLLLVLCDHAPASLKAEITQAFRCGIEDVLSRTDDKAMPASFYSTLLGEFNAYMRCL